MESPPNTITTQFEFEGVQHRNFVQPSMREDLTVGPPYRIAALVQIGVVVELVLDRYDVEQDVVLYRVVRRVDLA